MATKFILRDCFIEVDNVDFSDHVSSVEITLTKDEIDTTNFGGDGRERQHGLKDDSFTINFQQNFAADQVDDTLYPLWDDELEFTVTVRPTSEAKGPANPEYSGDCILLEYQPLAGQVGELSETSVTLPSQRVGIARDAEADA